MTRGRSTHGTSIAKLWCCRYRSKQIVPGRIVRARGKDVLKPKRSSLRDDNFEMLVFLKGK